MPATRCGLACGWRSTRPGTEAAALASREATDGGVNNSRLGVTLSVPAGLRQSFKVAYSAGMVVRTGTDFRTLSVGWQWLWLTRP